MIPRLILVWFALQGPIVLSKGFEYTDAYRSFCGGNETKASSLAWSRIKAHPDDAEARFELFFIDKDFQKHAFQTYNDLKKVGMKPWEKILTADILLFTGSLEFEGMKEFLSQPFTNPVSESYRVDLVATLLDITSKERADTFSMHERAYELNPNPHFLATLLMFTVFDPKYRELGKKYLTEATRLALDHPWKPFLEKLVDRFHNTQIDIRMLYEGSYQICPKEDVFVRGLIDGYLDRQEYPLAEKLFRQFRPEIHEKDPYFNFQGVLIYAGMDRWLDVMPNLKLALASKAYYRMDEASYLNELHETLMKTPNPTHDKIQTTLINFLILFGLVILVWLTVRKMKFGKGDIEDARMLRRAEKEVAADTTEYVALNRYSSSEGVKDSDMVEITSQLNAEGLHVRYRSVSSGEPGGAFVDYVLESPLSEVEAAKKYLAKMK